LLAIVVGGIDKVVGILRYLKGLWLSVHSDGGDCKEQKRCNSFLHAS